MSEEKKKKNLVKEISKGVSIGKKVKKGVIMGLKAIDTVAPGTLEKVGKTLEDVQDKFDEHIGNRIENQIDTFQNKLDGKYGDKIEEKIDEVDGAIRAKVGNFVEMKNTVFGQFSKAGHLSYLGDSEVKDSVNIGAGTITCNYDGTKKSKTYIESGAFIGSGVELVAPVRIGKKAYVGAGSTITKDVSPESLAVSRSRQVEKKGWARRKRKK